MTPKPILILLGVLATALWSPAADMNKTAPEKSAASPALATFGGGCFWCLEAVFETETGVLSVTSGFAGGNVPNPTYEQVCTGQTGHAEVIQVRYDPAKISYEKLLDLFWRAHDPTTLNRQGPDRGAQYRSIILWHDEKQKRLAEESKKKAMSRFSAPIVTQIVPLTAFYPAEKYHQGYFRNNPNASYCRMVIAPKLEKIKKP